MGSTEIFARLAAQQALGRRRQAPSQDRLRVRSVDRVHRIEAQAEVRLPDQLGDAFEIEQTLHQRGVIGDRVDDDQPHRSELRLTDAIEIDVVDIRDAIAAYLATALVNPFG